MGDYTVTNNFCQGVSGQIFEKYPHTFGKILFFLGKDRKNHWKSNIFQEKPLDF